MNQRVLVISHSPLYEMTGPGLADLLQLVGGEGRLVILLCGRAADDSLRDASFMKVVLPNTRFGDSILRKRGILSRVYGYIDAQVRVVLFLIGQRRSERTFLLYQWAPILPAILARVMRFKLLAYIGGSEFLSLQAGSSDDKLLSWPLHLEALLTMMISARLLTVTSLEWLPRSLRSKATVAQTRIVNRHFIDKYHKARHQEHDKALIGFVGRLYPEKGVEELLQAFFLIAAETPDLRLQIVGGGPLLDKLRTSLSSHKARDRVQITGWVTNVEDYLSKMTLLVQPSRTEGLPSVVLEAMAAEVPVMISNVGWVRSHIRDGVDGFLLDSLKPREIAARVSSVLRSPTLLDEVAATAFRVLERSSLESQSLAEVWNSILS